MDKVAASGAIESEIRLGGPTVNGVEPTTDSNVAVMAVPPCLIPAAKPFPLIVATVLVVEDHVASDVTFCVLPSL